MMKRVLLATVLAAIVLYSNPSLAAGPYDGTWTGTVEGSGAKCTPGTITMQILGNVINGNLGYGPGGIRFKGTVSADGTVNGSYNSPERGVTGNLSGKISGGDFRGRYESTFQAKNASCVRNVIAKRS